MMKAKLVSLMLIAALFLPGCQVRAASAIRPPAVEPVHEEVRLPAKNEPETLAPLPQHILEMDTEQMMADLKPYREIIDKINEEYGRDVVAFSDEVDEYFAYSYYSTTQRTLDEFEAYIRANVEELLELGLYDTQSGS